MPNVAFQQLGGIAGGMLKNILYAIGLIAFSAGLWYLTRFFQKRSKRNKQFTINAVIIGRMGSIDFDKIGLIKDMKHNVFEMPLKKRGGKKGLQDSLPLIPNECIINGWVVLYNYAAGQYAPVDPSSWKYLQDKDFLTNPKKFKLVDIGMKHYLFLRQTNIMNDGEEKKRNLMKKLPWYTIAAVLVLGLITVALVVFVGNSAFAHNIATRLAECKAAKP